MRIGKKAALMAAASATLVLVGAGSAAAYGVPAAGKGGTGNGLGGGGFSLIFQTNDCDAASGTIAPVGGAAPVGDTSIGGHCSNIASG
ncbi:hypothetical protein [Streptomyces sp. NPDC048636]|uniref:hypothetical protein n=1 Tax=Streptomyces sp. NPDC048636 TaxID=3155762 RepID=UPI00344700BF